MADAESGKPPLLERVADAVQVGARRVFDDGWLLVQGAVAATAAWVIAKYALGHSQPFFAPVAAVIGLNSSLGERGLHAVQLLYGVLVGILVGELALFAVGDGYGTLALATFVAMAIAHALGGVERPATPSDQVRSPTSRDKSAGERHPADARFCSAACRREHRRVSRLLRARATRAKGT